MAPRKDTKNSPKTKQIEKDTDAEVVREFGGAPGAVFVMIFSHVFIYYVWACLEFNDAEILYPKSFEDIVPFFVRFYEYITIQAAPTLYTWKIYLGFLVFQIILANTMPGIKVKGLPVPSEKNVQHVYNCNGVYSWYVTLLVVGGLHFSGYFPLTEVSKNLGPLISTAIIFSDITAVLAYVSAIVLGKAHRMSGNVIYDFFMGAWLNPRPFGNFDLKFWAETRVAWIMLWLLTASAAATQYEIYGSISGSMIFMLVAHGLYTNACMKGEECIPTTWDVFYEKWGWMLIYWNFAGVPFFYCAQSVFLTKHNVQLSPGFLALIFVALFGAYYIWDTSQSQRNRYRMQLRGTYVPRYSFPQLPWGTLKEPIRCLETKCGSKLLIDGWWRYARKIHYTCDVVMGLCWGLSCGFSHFLPYLYVSFFVSMISHRYIRDVERCKRKYGDDWKRYQKAVPYAFVPYVF